MASSTTSSILSNTDIITPLLEDEGGTTASTTATMMEETRETVMGLWLLLYSYSQQTHPATLEALVSTASSGGTTQLSAWL